MAKVIEPGITYDSKSKTMMIDLNHKDSLFVLDRNNREFKEYEKIVLLGKIDIDNGFSLNLISLFREPSICEVKICSISDEIGRIKKLSKFLSQYFSNWENTMFNILTVDNFLMAKMQFKGYHNGKYFSYVTVDCSKEEAHTSLGSCYKKYKKISEEGKEFFW